MMIPEAVPERLLRQNFYSTVVSRVRYKPKTKMETVLSKTNHPMRKDGESLEAG